MLRQQRSRSTVFWGSTGLVTHQEDLIGTFAERGVVRAIHWSLAGKLGVKLANIISRLLPKQTGQLYHLEATGRRGGCCKKRPTHQERFEWGLYFASEEVIPVYMTEEWVGLQKHEDSDIILIFHSHHQLS